MKILVPSKFALGFLLASALLCRAQDATWTGSVSSEWNLSGNWDPNTTVPQGTASFGGVTGTVNVNAVTEIEKIRLNNNGNWTFTGSKLVITGQETGSGTRPLSVGSNVQVVFKELVEFTQTGSTYRQFDIASNAVDTKVTFEKGISGNSLVTDYSFQTIARTAVSAEVNIFGSITNVSEIAWRTQSSTLNISAASSVSNQTLIAVNNVHLQLGHNSALGTGILNLNATSGGAGEMKITLEALGQNRSYSNGLTLNTGGNPSPDYPGVIVVTGNYDLSFSGATVVQRATKIQVDAGRRFELSGAITSPTTDRYIHKTGAGTLVLSGSSINPRGSLQVSKGTLLINGQVDSSTSDNVLVRGEGILGGSGTILRNVAFENEASSEQGPGGSGVLNPGDSSINQGIGTLTIGSSTVTRSLTLLNASQLVFDLHSTNSHDSLTIYGNLTLDGVLNLVDRGVTATGDFRLISYTGTLTNRGLEFGQAPVGWEYLVDSATPNEVWLRVSAIPEPSVMMLCVIAGSGILLFRRRNGERSFNRN